jgi:hypothetical protein
MPVVFQRMRNREAVEAPSHDNTITVFPELRGRFGAIWSRWKNMRDEFGPGFYLYLGLRRGMAMYIEHRFVNLIWGSKPFTARRAAARTPSPRKSGGFSTRSIMLKTSDGWQNALNMRTSRRSSSGSSKSLRCFHSALMKKKLRAFCHGCARLRNDISYFGGGRHDASYSEFLTDANTNGEALSVLYHALLLHEAGIDGQMLKRWAFESVLSDPIKIHFVEAGLLDKSVLRADDPPNA